MPRSSDNIRKVMSVLLAEGWSLLPRDPAAAESKARAMLDAIPGFPDALLLEGRACAAMDQPERAIDIYREATRRAPEAPQTWRALADLLFRHGDGDGAAAAFAKLIETSVREPRLCAVAADMKAGRLREATAKLQPFLKAHPNDVAGLRMDAALAVRKGLFAKAEATLRAVLARAPGFDEARLNLVSVLLRVSRPADAIPELDEILAIRPNDRTALSLKGAALGRTGDHELAVACFEAILAQDPDDARAWLGLGHAKKTIGRQAEAIAAYRKCINLMPTLGEAWWSLADLKTVVLDRADLVQMEAARVDPALTPEDRCRLAFAIGKAREEAGDPAAAFASYAEGNRDRRATITYDPEAVEALVDRAIALFTPAFFAKRTGWGSTQRDPIFVLGMPRAGSTLIEQILASHPDIEGTQELPDMPAIAHRLSRHVPGRTDYYPFQLADLEEQTMTALGIDYLAGARLHRKTARPQFVDKMPHNWLHVGLIHLLLPNATIIDARRHPLGCCFSNYRQLFGRGHDFSYNLVELGRYYAAYVRFMAHVDQMLPGRVHRVFHEAMVDDTEGEVRRLLDHVGVAFDPACLRFHETDRAVRTSSSEQVRRPIFRDGVDHWRQFDPWLGPLRDALGPVLGCYPAAPQMFDRTLPTRSGPARQAEE